jgi:hypothetical protein
MKPRTKIIIAVFILVTSSVTFLLVVVAALPLRLDELLITNDEFCCVDTYICPHPNDYQKAPVSGLKLGLVPILHKHVVTLFHHSLDFIVWRLAVHLWDRCNLYSPHDKIIKNDFTEQLFAQDADSSNIPQKCPNDTENTLNTSGVLHPMCRSYREFRSRLHIQQILIPWNWYHSCRLRLKRLSIRSAINKTHRAQSPHFAGEHGRVPSPSTGVLELSNNDNTYNLHSKNMDQSQTELPPSMEIESVDVSFQSWIQPVVSIHAKDIALNFVIQKGMLPLPLPFPKKDIDTSDRNADSHTDENGGFSLSIGDMTIQEAVELLPKPPEREGIYPMIGVVNVSNVTVYLWEINSKKGQQQQQQQKSLHVLTKLKIPDEFFIPVVDLTSGECDTDDIFSPFSLLKYFYSVLYNVGTPDLI